MWVQAPASIYARHMSAFLEVRARAKAAGIGDDVVIAFQKFDGTIDVDHLLDETLADTLRAASVAKDYFKTAKQKAGQKGAGNGGGKGAGKGKAGDAKFARKG